jgi:hypothetical protein
LGHELNTLTQRVAKGSAEERKEEEERRKRGREEIYFISLAPFLALSPLFLQSLITVNCLVI